ncbi:MAG: DUF4381 domain-containing protein [Xanthomonadales bacterium]|nr:DUF4381 domain-containing protein [Xanthomonadales bacterium]
MKSPDPASLQNLNDIIMPAEISWWPLASGWYFLLTLLLVLGIWLVFHLHANWIKNQYRREALLQLQQLENGIENTANRDTSLRQIPSLLKRTAVSAYPREQVASLTGKQWSDFLNTTLKKPAFNPAASAALEKIAYSGGSLNAINSESVLALINACRYWLQHHQSEGLAGEEG